jgi:iron complex transport system ATP-binding protein
METRRESVFAAGSSAGGSGENTMSSAGGSVVLGSGGSESGATLPLLGVYGVSCEYGGCPVLDEISFELQVGKILSVIGPNGSGKSTLLKSIAGLLPRLHGVVRYRGTDITQAQPSHRAKLIAYVGADFQVEFPLRAEEAVLLGRAGFSAPAFQQATPEDTLAVERAMERSLCKGLRDRYLHTLSGGERQLVSLARALAQGARILLLDESLSRMDLNHQQAIGKLLVSLARDEGYAIVLVSHDLNVAAEWADEALLLKLGKRVAHGPIRDVLTPENVQKLYPGAQPWASRFGV